MNDFLNTSVTANGEKSSGQLPDIELNYKYWSSKAGWLIGCLDIWPEHLTQGCDLSELEEMLADLYEFYKDENEINIEKNLEN